MTRYLIVSLFAGLLFAVLDGAINGNPLAVRLFEVYAPIARPGVNIQAGIIIDLVYGLVMGALFLMLHPALPGAIGLTKGLSFGLIMWFFRVVMSVASIWMMHKVPVPTLAYVAGTGLVEMLVIGAVLGVGLRR